MLLVAAAVGLLALTAALLSPPLAPPPQPAALAQWGPGGQLAAGGAVNRGTIVLSFQAGAGTSSAVPEVEIAPAGHSFSGRVSVRGRPIAAGRRSITVRLIASGLRDGLAYRWRARLRGRDGRASRWIVFGAGHAGSAAFMVDLTPPPAPRLSSPTDPNTGTWYTSPLATVSWPAPRDAGGIAGYAYRLDRDPAGAPPSRLLLRRGAVRLRIPAEGTWYVHVRTRDRAGNWSPVSTYPLHVDLHPAAFTAITFAQTAFDPDVERERVAIILANAAHVRVQVLRQDGGAPVRALDLGRVAGQTTLVWDGRDGSGHLAPDGFYRFLITATDRVGRQAVADYSDIDLLRRRVVVSLSEQRMVAYEGTRAVTSTLVTTGNKLLPTPLGLFHVILKRHPFTFISPWPQGSPLYYPPSPVQYALLFDWGGFYIHDAPWRSHFGPGSNAKVGTPGQNTTGTHGCVNVPPNVAAWLYDWAPVGTAVQVVP